MNTRTTYDVLVAGEGFSGLCAAIFAARAGKRVLIITRGAGVLAIGGGSIDVLGTDTDGHALHFPFDGLASLPPRHPYSLVGEQTVHKALEAFLELCQEEGYPYVRSDKGNMRLITALGTTKPSYMVPRTLDMHGIEAAETIYVVGVEGLKDFSPKLVVEGLSDRSLCSGKKLIPLTLPSPFRLQRDLGTLDLARHLDSQEGIDWLVRELLAAIGPSSTNTSAVLIPPILGTKPDYIAHEAVEQRIGMKTCEIVALAPAVTGLRLYTMLTNLLRKYGVDVIEQAELTGSVVKDGRCEALLTRSGGRERHYAAKSFIIATGGVLGEGFKTTPDRAWEPIFNLDLPLVPCSPEWSQAELFPAAPLRHGFALLGPHVDSKLRPLAADGSPLCSNVAFIGKTLGGYDHATEKSGNGVALATAWFAALNA